jgi:hypothetical protein
MAAIMKKISLFTALLCFALAGCELYEYGRLGGADITGRYKPRDEQFIALMENLSGVWYSHYAGIGRLDGYRIGKWEDFDTIMAEKKAMLPQPVPAQTYGASAEPIVPADYFVFYDSSVYGQKEDQGPSAPGWDYNFGFCGIVRGVNLFYGRQERGAIIIEYLEGCAPQWDADIKDGQRPFFGIYYRFLEPDRVQMANAVDLEALYNGEKYYTEKKTLQEAIDSNTVENEAEYISWGVVIPQDREK